jgi:hypothetical protein
MHPQSFTDCYSLDYDKSAHISGDRSSFIYQSLFTGAQRIRHLPNIRSKLIRLPVILSYSIAAAIEGLSVTKLLSVQYYRGA